jgi:hypothetical protein
MQPATVTLRLVGPMTAGQFSPILTRVNEIHPRATLHWNADATECSFTAATFRENLEARVERALELELGPQWRERVDALGPDALAA